MSNELDTAFAGWLASDHQGAALARTMISISVNESMARQLLRIGFMCGFNHGIELANKIVSGSQQQAGAA